MVEIVDAGDDYAMAQGGWIVLVGCLIYQFLLIINCVGEWYHAGFFLLEVNALAVPIKACPTQELHRAPIHKLSADDYTQSPVERGRDDVALGPSSLFRSQITTARAHDSQKIWSRIIEFDLPDCPHIRQPKPGPISTSSHFDIESKSRNTDIRWIHH